MLLQEKVLCIKKVKRAGGIGSCVMEGKKIKRHVSTEEFAICLGMKHAWEAFQKGSQHWPSLLGGYYQGNKVLRVSE